MPRVKGLKENAITKGLLHIIQEENYDKKVKNMLRYGFKLKLYSFKIIVGGVNWWDYPFKLSYFPV